MDEEGQDLYDVIGCSHFVIVRSLLSLVNGPTQNEPWWESSAVARPAAPCAAAAEPSDDGSVARSRGGTATGGRRGCRDTQGDREPGSGLARHRLPPLSRQRRRVARRLHTLLRAGRRGERTRPRDFAPASRTGKA